MRSTVKKSAGVGVLSVLIALCAVMPGWGTGQSAIRVLNLPDRDAVVLEGMGEALESTLAVHKLNPSRLELMFKTDAGLPSSPLASGSLVQNVQLGSRDDGFLMTLNLSGDVPVNGAEPFYRETTLAGGRSVIEIFRRDSSRSPFKPEWLLSEGGATPVQTTPVGGGFVPDRKGTGFQGASFDARSSTLTLRGVARDDVRIEEQSFPPRIDVQLNGVSTAGASTGLVHKDLSGSVTNVEVLDARGGNGLVVRAMLANGTSLLRTEDAGGDLKLIFAAGAAAPATPAAGSTAPTRSFSGQSYVPPAGSTAAASNDNSTSWSSASPADSGFSQSMSSSVTSPGPAFGEASAPSGFGGTRQQVPSVDQILQMAQDDARRYAGGARTRDDKYGSYKLPGFEGEEELLSDVRVNLQAAGGFSLYQFIMFLSQISGISIIIDPYWVDDPTGNPRGREPADPGFIPGDDGGSGFRGAGIFDPQFGASGSVRGNFDNVPFDQALDIVLSTNNLKKVVYRDKNDPYAKPVILITSRARLEYELDGTNEIDLYQLHYADPTQLVQILDQLQLLPLVNVGWYVYRGSQGNQGGGGQGGGGGGFGGGGGGGNRGGGGGGFNSIEAYAAIAGGVRNQYFDPLQTGQPMQATPPGGGGGVGGGGGGGGQGGGGGGFGGGGGAGGGQGNGLPVPTAKSGLVIMRGTRETLDVVQSLIAKIDKPPKQVALNVKIYQVSDEPENVWGLIAATAQNDRLNFGYGLGQLTVDILPKGGVLLDENYTAAFDFLQRERKVKVISEQSVAVLDGFTAFFDDSRTRGQLVTTLTFDANNNPIRSAQFNPITVGNSLDFTPQVDDRGRVTLQVNIDLSTFDGPEQVAPSGDATFQPTRNTTLSTVLRMADGQTAMIGGVTNREDSYVFEGIPYLSRLPLVGRLFGRNQKVNTVNHLFILIQLQVIDDK